MCPANIRVGASNTGDALVVQELNTDHTCSVSEQYYTYPEIRCNITEEAQSMISTLSTFNVRNKDIAAYLREKGHTVTPRGISNWRGHAKRSAKQQTDGDHQKSKRTTSVADERLYEIETKRLKVEEEKLEVERRRLAVEEARLEVEQQRLDVERQRLAVECCSKNVEVTTVEAAETEAKVNVGH